MLFDGGYTYSNFLMNMIALFAFVVWFWLLVVIFGDLFRRADIAGWGKALWVIALVLFSYLAILAYLITQGSGMAERNAARLGFFLAYTKAAMALRGEGLEPSP